MGIIIIHVGERFLFLAGIILGGGCTILFGVLDEINNPTLFIVFCFLVRGFEALGTSGYLCASFTILANEFPDSLASAFGFLGTMSGLGLSVGPAIGGFLYSVGGYKLPFLIVGGVMLLSFPITWYLLPEDKVGTLKDHEITSMKSLLKIPATLIICLAITITASMWGFLDPTLEPHLKAFSLSAQHIGLMFLLMSAFYGFSSPLWGLLTDKLENSSVSMIVCGLIGASVGLFLLGPAPFATFLPNVLWLNIVSLIVLGLSESLALIPTFECLLLSAYDHGLEDNVSTYGLVAGLWSSSYSLGEVIGPSIGGYLYDNYKFPKSSSIMGAVALLTALIISVFFEIERCLTKKSKLSDVSSLERAPLLSNSFDLPEFSRSSKIYKSYASSDDGFVYNISPRKESPMKGQYISRSYIEGKSLEI